MMYHKVFVIWQLALCCVGLAIYEFSLWILIPRAKRFAGFWEITTLNSSVTQADGGSGEIPFQ